MRAASLEIRNAGPDMLQDVEAVEDLRDARVIRKGGDHRGGVLLRGAGEVVHEGMVGRSGGWGKWCMVEQ